MIDTLLNLVFRCAHRRLTRPVTPTATAKTPHGETYVVCLDCGKQFSYDAKEMRLGKAINHDHGNDGVGLPPVAKPAPQNKKRKRAFLAAVTSAILVGLAAIFGKKREKGPRGEPRRKG